MVCFAKVVCPCLRPFSHFCFASLVLFFPAGIIEISLRNRGNGQHAEYLQGIGAMNGTQNIKGLGLSL
jgi:hypothetical protein